MASADEDLVSLIEEIDLPDRHRKLKTKIKKATKASTKRKDRSRSVSPVQSTLQPSGSAPGNSGTLTPTILVPQDSQSQVHIPLPISPMQPSGSTSTPAQLQAPPDFSQFLSWFQSTIQTTLDKAVIKQSDRTPVMGGKRKRKRSPSPPSEDDMADASPTSPKESDSYSSTEEGAISDSQSSSSSEDISKQPEEVKDLLRYIFTTLEIKEEQVSLSKADKVLGNSSKRPRSFPVCRSTSRLIETEWAQPDKKVNIPPKFFNNYPVQEEFKIWDKIPKVDPPIVRLSRHTMLPAEDAGSLRDPMDKKMDYVLKKDFQSAAAILRPAAAASTVAKTAKYWCQELSHSPPTDPEKFLQDIDKIKSALTFLGEATLDITKLAARASAASVAARRALWLRHWAGDTTSKNRLTSLKFSGSQLFGPELKQIISEVTGGKGAFLPQAKRPRRDFHRRNYHHQKSWSTNGNKQSRPPRQQGQGQSNRRYRSPWQPSWQNQQKFSKKPISAKGQDS
ncbi:lamina-associated polypeptide 2, isoforms alpha/zeta-like [Xenopus laevis]|uniref:Lamina-associated polypeptide 2, isoforms alpha/zeta-like n=1 Tax=Xenopus laevis TaxID=8355 RepID=A0A8J1L557_XENLA|nr:lamina-associated polypeptide 2, isoforms alpha/zeta-like [Xenopus laevis]